MNHFLLKRPIGVLVICVGLLILGFYYSQRLPVSMLPNISIPQIQILINQNNASAEEIETSEIEPLRLELSQVNGIISIESETRNGFSIIKLLLDFDADGDKVYNEINMRIDRIMHNYPIGTERPRVIKTSAVDIPVININVESKNPSEESFIQLSEFAETILKRRLEQLDEIAFVDITGLAKTQILIQPIKSDLDENSVSYSDINRVLIDNNIDYGVIRVKDSIYEYNIRFAEELHGIEEINKLQLVVSGRVIKLTDICKVTSSPQKMRGMFLNNGNRAINMAIIKKSDVRMEDMTDAVKIILHDFENEYPTIHFSTSQDQTLLLNSSINNLKSDLVFGSIFAFIILFFFFRNFRLPVLIFISVPTALILSMLFFGLLGMSINIISLAGLVMGIGMVVDNSIIIIDSIHQKYLHSKNLSFSCVEGTKDVMRPMLSSILTTCSVFFPLVIIGGLAGKIFFNQALGIACGLVSSYLAAILLIPTLYYLLFKNNPVDKLSNRKTFLEKALTRFYDKGLSLVFRYKLITIISVPACLLIVALLIIPKIPTRLMPEIQKQEFVMTLDWNEPISIEENARRVTKLLYNFKTQIITSNSYVGEQQFLLQNKINSFSESDIYVKANNSEIINSLEAQLRKTLEKNYPNAALKFTSIKNVFELIFNSDVPSLQANIFSKNKMSNLSTSESKDILKCLSDSGINFIAPSFETNISIAPLMDRLILYNVSYNVLYEKLSAMLGENIVTTIKANGQQIPVVIGLQEASFQNGLNNLFVSNELNELIPVRNLISVKVVKRQKIIFGGRDGKYFPIIFNIENDKELNHIKNTLATYEEKHPNEKVAYSGYLVESKSQLNNLWKVLLISLLLLYAILAAQFESLTQPIIVLLEIPFDLIGALLALWIFGYSFNIMSAIGLIVMCGIVLNDSILKVDAINKMRNKKLTDEEAIFEGGHLRFKSIVMTTLTTMLGFSTVLLTGGIGSELQRPLAITLIGGLIVGTFISLFYMPVLFSYLLKFSNRRKN